MAKVKEVIKALRMLDPEAEICYGEGIARGVKCYPLNEIRKFRNGYVLAGMVNPPLASYTRHITDI